MARRLADESLASLEGGIHRALASGNEEGLDIIGYGEITMAVAHRDGELRFACKRLPPFSSMERVEAYGACLSEYLASLRSCGVDVLETELQHTPSFDGGIAVYCVQRILDAETLVPKVLAKASEKAGQDLFRLVLERILATATPRLGIDGQLSNWAFDGKTLHFIDVSTPMMRDDAGRERLDLEIFLASLPWILRGLVRRFLLRGILDAYYDPRRVVIDLLANLYKEDLGRWVPEFLSIANGFLSPTIEESEVKKYYKDNAATWALLQRVRRLDRLWHRLVRRRTYPFLLPGRIERHT